MVPSFLFADQVLQVLFFTFLFAPCVVSPNAGGGSEQCTLGGSEDISLSVHANYPEWSLGGQGNARGVWSERPLCCARTTKPWPWLLAPDARAGTVRVCHSLILNETCFCW